MEKFEDTGLFVGLVSYPFYVDGEVLFNSTFSPFFKRHRKYLESASAVNDTLSSYLYKPTAYRMFGKFGLAIFSLIDDFAFCTRIFNAGHIRIAGENKYKSVVLVGSSDDEEEYYLRKMANESFLLDQKKFPFIAIIRLKIDYQLLLGYGRKVTQEIKTLLRGYSDNFCGCTFKSFTVDCYDNDELLVVAFSNSLNTLHRFMYSVRETGTEQFDEDRFGGYSELWAGKKHVFSACHMSYGYHIDFDFSDQHRDFMDLHPSDGDVSKFSVNCLVETKPGHQDPMCEYLKQFGKQLYGECSDISETVTGGSTVHFRIPVGKISTLHREARENTEFKCHIQRIKLTLNVREPVARNETEEKKLYHKETEEDALISFEEINTIRNLLTKLGVSKVVRDRLLAMLDLYDDCSRNKLQTYYFEQMQPAVQNIKFILEGLEKRESGQLWEVENLLNEEISAFETAFYNRMNNKMTPNAILDYSGGIQQFLQAFGYAYRSLVSVCAPQEAGKQYSLITGLSKEFSVRTHTELNINHIVYPQLFATTSWKEASNFAMQVLDSKMYETSEHINDQKIQQLFSVFSSFISEKKSFDSIKNLLFQQTELAPSNIVYKTINSLINQKLLKYLMSDFLVYHFAFQRDYKLMWYHYFKAFLQTTSVYARKNEVSLRNLVFLLLRLFCLAEIEQDASRSAGMKNWIKKSSDESFDYLVSNLWLVCFNDTNIAAKNIVSNLSSYGLIEVCEQLVQGVEYVLIEKERYPDFYADYLSQAIASYKNDEDKNVSLNAILNARCKKVLKIQQGIEAGTLSFDTFECDNPSSPDNVICLLSAFLYATKQLGNSCAEVKSLPRLEDGNIDFSILRANTTWFDSLLSDPVGGFVVPNHRIRQKYFMYRTALYRVLWDLSYRSKLFSK